MRHTLLAREVDTVVYVYLVVDPRRAAASLAQLDNPYQIWAALTGASGLGLNRDFSSWVDLLKYAPSNFDGNGKWTGGTLEPLLLVIAQDALRLAQLPQDSVSETIATREREFESLTAGIAAIIAGKPEGSALALRWAAWLFRMSSGELDRDSVRLPPDLRHKTAPFWRMLEALTRSDVASGWNAIAAADAPSEDVLCLLSVKILAANERKSELPDREPLWRCVPTMPEEFLGEHGRKTRDLTLLFSSSGARPDSIKFRILSMLFLNSDTIALYRDFWKRTLTLRELAEHWQSGDQNDGRTDAKRVLAMALSIGLSLVDCYAVASLQPDADVVSRSCEFGELFGSVYDGLREVSAIELFEGKYWSNMHAHLIARRALYENASSGAVSFPAPLFPETRPTLGYMLANIAGVTQAFFNGLDGLPRNGIAPERTRAALKQGDVDLSSFLNAARALNRIDPHRPLQIKAAEAVIGQSEV